MPARKATPRATPTPIPIFGPFEDEEDSLVSEPSDDFDADAMDTSFCGKSLTNKHCDKEKLPRSQSTIRYLRKIRSRQILAGLDAYAS
jgi:hypothetical protein